MKNLKKTIIASLIVFSALQAISQSSFGAIKGQVINSEGEPVFGATVKITQSGVLVGGTSTDENGKYTYKPLDAGQYEVLTQSIEFQTKRVSKVEVNPDKTSYVDFKVSLNVTGEVVVEAIYVKPIIDNSYITMKSISGDDLKVMAVDRGDIKAAIVNITSDVSEGENGDLHVRGSRGDATVMIVDGVRTPNLTGVPALSVENLSIITGGIPAQYGDATSGVIIVTTKDYFSGIRSKHMRENYQGEKQARIKREKNAKADEEKRKLEIEAELKAEEEAKAKKG